MPPCAVPGYVQAVRQLGAGRDQALVWVQAATGEPDTETQELTSAASILVSPDIMWPVSQWNLTMSPTLYWAWPGPGAPGWTEPCVGGPGAGQTMASHWGSSEPSDHCPPARQSAELSGGM